MEGDRPRRQYACTTVGSSLITVHYSRLVERAVLTFGNSANNGALLFPMMVGDNDLLEITYLHYLRGSDSLASGCSVDEPVMTFCLKLVTYFVC